MEETMKGSTKTLMHTLIVGEQGVGKSTLIRRVLEKLDVPVCGYLTRKEDMLADPELGSPIYIYEIGQPALQTPENLVGHCKAQKPVVYPEAFDRFAEKLEKLVTNGSDAQNTSAQSPKEQNRPLARRLILLDEIGVMEARSEAFCQAIMKLLDGDTPILAAVKYKDRPFLNQVRSHPRCHCFTITPDNRNELAEDVSSFMKEQLTSAQLVKKQME